MINTILGKFRTIGWDQDMCIHKNLINKMRI
jgi:hypothetical protein